MWMTRVRQGEICMRYEPFNSSRATLVHLIIHALLVTVVFSLLAGCTRDGTSDPGAGTTIIFKHGKIAGDAAQFRNILDRFEQEHPGITVKDETLPASTDEQHQFYAINLEGKSAEFDVLSLDVIWVQEFARAGWLREVGHLLGAGEAGAFFAGPIEANTFGGRLYAIPWYVDAGVLYYRKDLLAKHGQKVPKTWQDLVRTAQAVTAKERDLYGFVWQGKQYEGLVCNVLEYIWSNGGDVLRDGKVVLNSQANREALGFMRDLIARNGVSPPLVTTAIEEPTRHLFEGGKALFMRNWPYAWNIFQREGSPVKGAVGVAPLPSFAGHRSASTLGGWQLGINRNSRHPEAAEKFVQFLSSPAAQKELALTVGYKPSRRSLYKDRDLLREQPFLTSLYGVMLSARPRPVTPYYMVITQVLQPAFSAVISEGQQPGEALAAAQKQIEQVIGGTTGVGAVR